MNISSLRSKAAQKTGEFDWVDPRNVTGLPAKDEIIHKEKSGEWDESVTDALYDYVEQWFQCTRRTSYFDDGHPMSPIERYVDAMLHIFVNYHNSVAGLFSLEPEAISFEDAKKCLPIFKRYICDETLTEFERKTVQMYLTDFYQFDDLWSPPEGRFYAELSDEENTLLAFLSGVDGSFSLGSC